MPLTKNVCKSCELPHASSEELRGGMCIECLFKDRVMLTSRLRQSVATINLLLKKKRARKKV